MAKSIMIPIRGEKLKDDLAKKGYSMARASELVGFTGGYLAHRIKENRIKPSQLRMICRETGLNPEDYMIPISVAAPENEIQKPAVTTPGELTAPQMDFSALVESINQLREGLIEMKTEFSSMAKSWRPVIAQIAKCIIILDDLTKFGSCNYKAFTDKCQAEGMDEAIMAIALNFWGYRVFTGNGMKQISRK